MEDLGGSVWRLRLMGSMHEGEGTRGRELKRNCKIERKKVSQYKRQC